MQDLLPLLGGAAALPAAAVSVVASRCARGRWDGGLLVQIRRLVSLSVPGVLIRRPAGAPTAVPGGLLEVVQLDVVIVLGQGDDLAAALDRAFGKLLFLHAVLYGRRRHTIDTVVLNSLMVVAIIHGKRGCSF